MAAIKIKQGEDWVTITYDDIKEKLPYNLIVD